LLSRPLCYLRDAERLGGKTAEEIKKRCWTAKDNNPSTNTADFAEKDRRQGLFKSYGTRYWRHGY